MIMKQFSEKVYDMVRQIPKGRVATYKSIALALNMKGYRAVGQALKRNRNPDVPCHRVIKSSGEIGGYRGTDAEAKVKLLEKEGVKIIGGRIDLKKYGYTFSI